KLPLLYFLFKYGKIYGKEFYTNFALEKFGEILINEFSEEGDPPTDFYQGSLGIGWGLVKFIEEGFFEFDELDDTLSKLDAMVFREMDQKIESDLGSVHGLLDFLGMGFYLRGRAGLAKKESRSPEILRYLFKTVQKIINIPCDLSMGRPLILSLFYHFISQCNGNDMDFDVPLQADIEKFQATLHKEIASKNIIDQYQHLLLDNEVYGAICYNNCLANELPEILAERDLLIQKVYITANEIMGKLYSMTKNDKETQINQLAILGMTLLDDKSGIGISSFSQVYNAYARLIT
uniref:hypothetical protein n=1 Tax=Flagellimonas onchidii TaxID=2562684 RepID=UPI0014561682